MPQDAGNITILHARSVRKTRTETTQQIAVPHGIPWISGKRHAPSDNMHSYGLVFQAWWSDDPSIPLFR